MAFVKRIGSCGTIPRGYGVAYAEMNSFTYVCVPLPLHIVVSLARRLWFAFRVFGMTDATTSIFILGYAKGRESESKFQYHEGYLAGGKAMAEAIRNSVKDALR